MTTQEKKSTPLPEGVELEIKFYLMSERDGLSTVFSLSGLTVALSDFDFDLKSIIANIAEMTKVDDWRAMTRAEIKAYKEEEKRADAESSDEED